MRKGIFVVGIQLLLGVLAVLLSLPHVVAALIFIAPYTLVWLFATSEHMRSIAVSVGAFPDSSRRWHFNGYIALCLALIGIIAFILAWDTTVTLSHLRLNLEPPNARYVEYVQLYIPELDEYYLTVGFGIDHKQINAPTVEIDIGVSYDKDEVVMWIGNPHDYNPTADGLRLTNIDTEVDSSVFRQTLNDFSIRPDRSLYFRFHGDKQFRVVDCRVWAIYDPPKRCGDGVRLIPTPNP